MGRNFGGAAAAAGARGGGRGGDGGLGSKMAAMVLGLIAYAQDLFSQR